jgi:hypothetical protein
LLLAWSIVFPAYVFIGCFRLDDNLIGGLRVAQELLHCDLKNSTPETRAIDVLNSTLASAVLTVAEWRYVRLAVKLLNSVLISPRMRYGLFLYSTPI